jgi:hypothetical protein
MTAYFGYRITIVYKNFREGSMMIGRRQIDPLNRDIGEMCREMREMGGATNDK